MQKIPLGPGGVDVSTYCLGAMYFGTRNDSASSYRLLDMYVEAGGSFVDTANIYAHWVPGFQGGESEILVGRWLAERRNRERMFIATKVGFDYPGVEIGLTAAQIEAECEKSLRRLGIDTIDLYYAHVDDRNTPLEVTLSAFERLVRAGKVRLLGASNYRAWRLAEAESMSRAHGWPAYCCVQQRYTYLRPKPGADFTPQLAANDDLIDYCRSKGIRLLAHSALLAGAYTRADREIPVQYLGPDGEARLNVLRQVAAVHKATPNQVIMAWLLQSDPAVIPVMAAGSEVQMQENLAALDLRLAPDEMAFLSDAGA